MKDAVLLLLVVVQVVGAAVCLFVEAWGEIDLRFKAEGGMFSSSAPSPTGRRPLQSHKLESVERQVPWVEAGDLLYDLADCGRRSLPSAPAVEARAVAELPLALSLMERAEELESSCLAFNLETMSLTLVRRATGAGAFTAGLTDGLDRRGEGAAMGTTHVGGDISCGWGGGVREGGLGGGENACSELDLLFGLSGVRKHMSANDSNAGGLCRMPLQSPGPSG